MYERPTLDGLQTSLHDFDPDEFGSIGDLLVPVDTNVRDLLFVGCSDHGTAPDNMSCAHPGRLYIVQNLAHSIPDTSVPAMQTVLGSIAYAVEFEKVRHAVVCGHLGCNVIPNWVREPPLPNALTTDFPWRARAMVDSSYKGADPDDLGSLYVREHVLCQLENLRSHEFIRTRLETGRLKLHGWVADDATARIHVFDASTGQFEPV